MANAAAFKIASFVVVIGCALAAGAQAVHVSQGNGSVSLTLSAQKSYELVAGESKRPTLTVQCSLKGKKNTHLIIFTASGALAEDSADIAYKSGAINLDVQVGGSNQSTSWIPYGDSVTYAYYGKTEPEREKFLQEMLSSPSFSIQFTPFLTGSTITSTFDLSKLQTELTSHPECLMK